MKTKINPITSRKLVLLFSAICTYFFSAFTYDITLQAGEFEEVTKHADLILQKSEADSNPEKSISKHTPRPDRRAPIGVRFDHMHKKGDVMFSYRYMIMRKDGLIHGDDGIGIREVFDAGFMLTPTSSEMEMHMFGIMYGVSDWLNLMFMGKYQSMSMTAQSKAGSPARMMRGKSFDTDIDGWGDSVFAAAFTLHKSKHQDLLLALGVGIPTGDFSFQRNYMQITSGSWDFIPALTWSGRGENFSGGIQLSGRINFDENDRGYALGDSFGATSWLARKFCSWSSLSARLNFTWQDKISGADEEIAVRPSPVLVESNHGGIDIEVGLGVNFLIPRGALRKSRIFVEYLMPVYQDRNGLQLEKENTIMLGLSKVW